jgi:hypothetical protein
VEKEGAFGYGAFIGGTEYWFLASRANNVNSDVYGYEHQVMSFPPIFMFYFKIYAVWSVNAWFMLAEVAFQAFVGGTSRCWFVAQPAKILFLVIDFQLLAEDQVMP